MRGITIIMSAVFLIVGFSSLASAQSKWEFPVIKGYGPVHPLPHAAVQPNKSLNYKILFDVTHAAKMKTEVNPALDHIARLINVYASAGMMPSQMKLVVIIHGPATPIVLNDAEYKAKFGTDNPNIKLINDLKENGVVFYVCGQALADMSYEHSWVNRDITVALSALTVLPTYQLEGYALMPW